MLRHKNIDRLCCVVLALTLLLTCGYMGAAAAGFITGDYSMGYEERLFDQSRVHTLDIVIDDWDAFLDTCTSEEYSVCTVVIDGENFGSVGIRGKGNTSLSSVQSYGNDRYSFKVEFDQYQSGKTYHGLDKLSLNNLIQDTTYMKDYLAYTLMNRMGVAAPLCSFVQINVNGEPWGLYLAVEGVEDSFLARNYGKDAGELYKPDSMSFGGGRGNGREFDMEAFSEQFSMGEDASEGMSAMPQMPGGFDPSAMFGGFDPSQMMGGDFDPSEMFGGFDPTQMGGGETGDGNSKKGMSFGFGGMGSGDVMLQYSDDDPSSYSNIFNNAKTEITEADQKRLIESLKTLSEGENIESVVDTDAVIRYLVVHNFMCNDDSYTGMMVHNYYLHEDDGVLSMIPWDYNLAFGAFSMGGMGMGSGATSTVNSPIDSPVSSGDVSSRPMIAWIFESEEYTQRYHEIYAQFVAEVYESGWLAEEIRRVSEMIAPYVESETRAFFSYDEFRTAIEQLSEFCELRLESISGQLDGSIPSTTAAQRSNSAALIDGSQIDLSAMGEFGMGGGMPGMGDRSFSRSGKRETTETAEEDASETPANMPEGMQMFGGQMPGGDMSMPSGGFPQSGMENMPEGMQMFGGQMPGGDMSMPSGGFQQSGMENMPEGMQMFGGQMPGGDMSMPSGGFPQSGMQAQTTQNPVEAQESEETVSEEAEPEFSSEKMFSGDFRGMQSGTDSSSLLLLAGSLILLIAAMLFAKFYKVNR